MRVGDGCQRLGIDLRDGAVGGLLVDIGDGDDAAFLAELDRRLAPDAAAATGDDD